MPPKEKTGKDLDGRGKQTGSIRQALKREKRDSIGSQKKRGEIFTPSTIVVSARRNLESTWRRKTEEGGRRKANSEGG